MFTHVGDILGLFEFAYQPFGHKVFKLRKVREVTNVNESGQIWGKRKNNKNSYFHPSRCIIDYVL